MPVHGHATCGACGATAPYSDAYGAAPSGWAWAMSCTTLNCRPMMLCGARCAEKAGESPMAVAMLWPVHGTAEAHAALIAYENDLVARSGRNPRIAGAIAGSVWALREARYDAMGGRLTTA